MSEQLLECLPYRQTLLTEPGTADPDTLAHLEQCSQCQQFQQSLMKTDDQLKAALSVPVPDNLAPRILLASGRKHQPAWRRWPQVAIAASITLAVFVLLSQFSEDSAIAAELAGHVDNEFHEVEAHVEAAMPVNAEAVLNRISMPADLPPGEVLFAGNCVHHGKLIAHLLIQSDAGQYTLLYLPDQSIKVRNHSDWHMVSRPLGNGTVVVMSKQISDLSTIAGIFKSV